MAISSPSEDCNFSFCLSNCYREINDLKNAIESLNNAIEFSKIDSQHTRKYKQNAKDNWIEDLTLFYEIQLYSAISKLELNEMSKKN